MHFHSQKFIRKCGLENGGHFVSARGRFELNFRWIIFNLISVIDGWSISCETDLRWMALDFADDKSTLVQVMAWCCQATSHYLGQCWPSFLLPYDVTRPQWVNPFFAMTYFIICVHFNLLRPGIYAYLVLRRWQAITWTNVDKKENFLCFILSQSLHFLL